MQSESSNISNGKDNFQNVKIEKEQIICKDGFCSIRNDNESSRIDKDDVNLFDPV